MTVQLYMFEMGQNLNELLIGKILPEGLEAPEVRNAFAYMIKKLEESLDERGTRVSYAATKKEDEAEKSRLIGASGEWSLERCVVKLRYGIRADEEQPFIYGLPSGELKVMSNEVQVDGLYDKLVRLAEDSCSAYARVRTPGFFMRFLRDLEHSCAN